MTHKTINYTAVLGIVIALSWHLHETPTSYYQAHSIEEAPQLINYDTQTPFLTGSAMVSAVDFYGR